MLIARSFRLFARPEAAAARCNETETNTRRIFLSSLVLKAAAQRHSSPKEAEYIYRGAFMSSQREEDWGGLRRLYKRDLSCR